MRQKNLKAAIVALIMLLIMGVAIITPNKPTKYAIREIK